MRTFLVCAALMLAGNWPLAATGQDAPAAAPGAAPAASLVLETRSFWRCFQMLRVPAMAAGDSVSLLPPGRGVKPVSAAPPADWMQPDFDDSDWWRAPGPFYEGYGFQPADSVALVCLRGKFGVDDPAKVKSLTLSCRYRGGVVIYLNGKEVKRASLPAGELTPDTPADVYPIEAYVQTDGKTAIRWGWGEPAKFKDRCELRLRKLEGVDLPAGFLRKGTNVLAVEIHRSLFAEGVFNLKEWWAGFRSHAGLDAIEIRTDSPDAVRSNLARPKGFQVWNAGTVMAIFDMDYGDPNEQLRPICIHGARNGSFSGQVVASCDVPIKGLKGTVGDLTQKNGTGRIAAENVQVRYAKPGGTEAWANIRYGTGEVNRFDALEETPPPEVPVYEKRQGIKPSGAVQPVWVTVSVPGNAPAGEYTGTLTISAEGQPDTTVPVILTVADWTLPAPKDYVTFIDLIQSPESVALQYNVPLWSDRHWELVEKTFKQLARVGNKTVYIPLICRTHFGNSQSMVRWVKQPPAGGTKAPEKAPEAAEAAPAAAPPDEVAAFLAQGGTYTGDFTVMEKYLDIAQKHLGTPEVVCFYVWEGWCGGGYFGVAADVANPRQVRRTPVTLLDPKTGEVTTLEGPTYMQPEAEAFLKPIADELRQRMKKRGLEGSIMLGISGDVRPTAKQIELWSKLIPEARWVSHSHGSVHSLGKVPVAYATSVWQAGFAPDPDTFRMYGWRRDGHPNKPKGQAFAQYNRDMVFNRGLIEHRMLAENNISGNQVGFGRNGADFWPVLKDKDGRPAWMLVNRYPESNWAQLSVKTCLLAPGPDGALSTVRWEMIVEGVQECEAKIFIEKALLDKAQRDKLGEETAKRLQAMLDERIRAAQCGPANPGWFVSSNWQERTRQLFAAAAEVARKLREPG